MIVVVVVVVVLRLKDNCSTYRFYSCILAAESILEQSRIVIRIMVDSGE